MKAGHKIPKSMIGKALAARNLIMVRGISKKTGKRMWLVSDGQEFESLRQVVYMYCTEHKKAPSRLNIKTVDTQAEDPEPETENDGSE